MIGRRLGVGGDHQNVDGCLREGIAEVTREPLQQRGAALFSEHRSEEAGEVIKRDGRLKDRLVRPPLHARVPVREIAGWIGHESKRQRSAVGIDQVASLEEVAGGGRAGLDLVAGEPLTLVIGDYRLDAEPEA